jgi:hypothetical protein
MIGAAELKNRFTYHAPTPGQPEIYQSIREGARELATHIDGLAPDSREKSLAIKALEEAVMWANAAIARHPADEDGEPIPGGDGWPDPAGVGG